MRLLRHPIVYLLLASGFPPSALAQAAPTAFEAARSERFLENRLACRGCHVIAGNGGAIGPTLDGIAERGTRAYVVSMIREPGTTVAGTIMPSQQMPPREAERLATYLMSLPARPEAAVAGAIVPPTIDPLGPPDGAALYARHCAACHGEAGNGDGWNATNLPVAPTAHADATSMSQRPDDTLFDGIAGGGYVLDRSPRMPAFGGMLSPAQIRALVAHIRTLCACEQPSWAGGSR